MIPDVDDSATKHRDADGVSPALLGKLAGMLASLPDDPETTAAEAEGRAVRQILEELGMPPETLAAAWLYPLYRRGIISVNQIRNKDLDYFSPLIISLRQLDRLTLPDTGSPGEAFAKQQSEALRKMLLAIVSDIRLVLVRIAQQLHRLRGAKQAVAEERRRLAVETLEIFAALANRLGVWQLKWELEDLAFRYLKPDRYRRIAKLLNEKRREREAFIAAVTARLGRELANAGIDAKISGRAKHIYSIYRKMRRKDRGLESLYDMRAVRVLVKDVRSCYAALGVVHKLWSYLPDEFDDYVAKPKDNGYRSLHTAVIGPEGKTVEVQIRTHEMHRQAELGIAAHWRYKEGGGSAADFDRRLAGLRQRLESAGDGSELDRLRDRILDDRVYAISPRGDVVELPAEATPLDFAYRVHTQVGHRCRGAKANGRIVPLTYRIRTGDRIEIITDNKPRPSRDWLSPKLGYIASARTRAKVRNWFRQQNRDEHRRQGREVLDRELSRLNVRGVATGDIAQQLKFADTDALCVALGAGDLTSAAIAGAMQQLKAVSEPLPKPRRKPGKASPSRPDGVTISGVGDLLSRLARCCRPVPPEPVVGYITQGRGVSIHRADCGNCLSLQQRHPERILAVSWRPDKAGRRKT